MRSTHRYKSINNKLMIMIAITSGVLLVVISVVVFLYLSGFFYQKRPVSLPVAIVSEETETTLRSGPFQAEAILKKTTELLSLQQETAPFFVSWYMLPGSVASMGEASSDYVVTKDQIDLLTVYIAMDKKEEANTLMLAIRDKLSGPDGYLLSAIRVTDITQKTGESIPELEPDDIQVSSSYFDTFRYTEALIAYYEKWGTEEGWKQISYYANLLYSEQSLVPAAFHIPVPTPTPAPEQFLKDNPSSADQEITDGDTYEYIPLSSLYLSTFKALADVDSRYSAKYEQARDILVDGMISDSVPLYAIAYDPEQMGYLYVADRERSLFMVPTLETCLQLAEDDQLSPVTLAWLKEHLVNQKILYQSYDVISGDESSEKEAYESYAIALQIGIFQDDDLLCRASMQAQENHLATNTNSLAKDALFRTVQENRISVYARENLLLLMALTTETRNAE